MRGQYRPVGSIGTSAASGTKLGKGTELRPRNLGGPVSTLLDDQETPTSGRRGQGRLWDAYTGFGNGPYCPATQPDKCLRGFQLYIINTRLHSTALGVARKVVARVDCYFLALHLSR